MCTQDGKPSALMWGTGGAHARQCTTHTHTLCVCGSKQGSLQLPPASNLLDLACTQWPSLNTIKFLQRDKDNPAPSHIYTHPQTDNAHV